MNYLIDTHVLLWFGEGNAQLPSHIQRIMLDKQNNLFVSHAAIWEMTIKHSLGKLNLQRSLPEWESLLRQNHFAMLPSTFWHFETLASLPFHHQDPFDRLMIAQAIAEDFTVVTHDSKFGMYPVRLEKF